MNLRWSSRGGEALRTALVCLTLVSGCASSDSRQEARKPPTDPAQADAELLAHEVADIVDLVMSYRSAHQGKLPTSFRQAGLDSLTPLFVRRLGREGGAPLVSITFRKTEGRVVASCQATNSILEEKLLRAGAFDLSCFLAGGGNRWFTIPGPPPPLPPKS